VETVFEFATSTTDAGLRATAAYLVHVAGRRLENARAAVRLDRNEAVPLQANQRLAHRRLRDAELGREPRLDELLARLEVAADDLVAKGLVDAPLELCRDDLVARAGYSYIVSSLTDVVYPA